MKESLGDESLIEKQINNEVIAMLDDQYVSYEPGPRHLDETFEQLRDAQAIFARATRYPSMEAAVVVGQKFANHMNGLFKQRGKESKQRMLGEVVSLSGDGVIVPQATIDYVNARSEIGCILPSSDEEVFEDQMGEVVGRFRGVGFLIKVDEGAQAHAPDGELMDCPYYVRLYYKIQIGAHHHPLGDVKLFALGEIGVANLEFAQDAEQQAIYDALSQLLSNDSIEIAELVNELNLVLSGSSRSAEEVRKIGELTKRLHASKALRPEDSDAVLNLITAYIPPYAPYAIDATRQLEYDAGNRDMQFFVVKAAEGEVLAHDQPVSGIVLATEYETEGDLEAIEELTEVGKVPYFVLEKDSTVVQIPMNHVSGFGRGSEY